MNAAIVLFVTVCVLQCLQFEAMKMTKDSTSHKAELVYSWVTVDFDWPNETIKQEYIASGRYLPFQNTPNGIKLYNDEVYMTVIRFLDGVPSTLNKVVKNPQTGFPVLQPFPSWDSQVIDDCNAFQNVPSMEIDPNNGWMWIIDVGRSSIFRPSGPENSCPAKLVIYDLKNMREIRRYEFPDDVASRKQNFLNDLVVDYVNGEPAFAYITDSGRIPGLVVYDLKKNTSYRFEDTKTMSSEDNAAIMVGTQTFDPKVPINGIALSSDFRYVYFSAVSGYTLYQVPSLSLQNPRTNISEAIRLVGQKPSQSDGMIYAKNNMFFGGLSDNSLYRWQVEEDSKNSPMRSEGGVVLKTVSPILTNVGMAWIDSLAIDNNGFLWFSQSNVGRLFLNELNFTQTEQPNFRVWKTYIGEQSYLNLTGDGGNSGASGASYSLALVITFTLALVTSSL